MDTSINNDNYKIESKNDELDIKREQYSIIPKYDKNKIKIQNNDGVITIYSNDIKVYQNNYVSFINLQSINAFVLDGYSGDYISSRYNFPDKNGNNYTDLNIFLTNVYNGYIVIIITSKLRKSISDYLIKLMSNHIKCFNQGDDWLTYGIYVFIKESYCFTQKLDIFEELSLDIPKVKKKVDLKCLVKYPDYPKRKEFCEKIFAFPEYCRCNSPLPISYNLNILPRNLDTILTKIPILVMSGNRPFYLIKSLATILAARGVRKELIIVDADEYDPELVAVVKLFDVKITFTLTTCFLECRINNHYNKALLKAFSEHTYATDIIIIEDDLIVSSDIFYYFASHIELYHSDTSIFCISAWNDHAYKHSVGDLTMTYRINFMPGLGVVFSRKIYQEFARSWPTNIQWNWDVWVRQSILGDRNCIIPDFSRTYHIGTLGIHITISFQTDYISNRPFLQNINVEFMNHPKTSTLYDEELRQSLKMSSSTMNVSQLCLLKFNYSPTLITKPLKIQELSSYITKVIVKVQDFNERKIKYNSITKCLKLWDLDERGFYKDILRVWINNRLYILIFCPLSPFCNL